MPPPERARSWLSRPLGWLGSPEGRPERAGLFVLLAVGALLLWRADQLPPIALVFLAVASLLAMLVLLRRGWRALLGPMFFYDLLCYARRGRYIALRCLYAMCLLAAIFGVYAKWFGAGSFGYPLPQDLVARFATSFFVTFLTVQLIAVFVVTPVVTASAIAEEKERRRLDFLLVTELRDHEIVLGKLASRVATVGFTLLTGLPILGLMQFLGGVDPNLVLAGFAVTLFTMVSVASVGMWMSSVCDKPISAMWLTYLLVLGYLGCCWCSPVLDLGHPGVLYKEIERQTGADGNLGNVLLGRVAAYGAFHLLVSGLSVALAMHSLRPERASPSLLTRQEFDYWGARTAALPTEPVRVILYPPPSPILRARPPIDEQRPLLWKELHLDQEKTHEALRGLIAIIMTFLLFLGLMIGLTVIFDAFNRGVPLGTTTNPMARGLGSALGCFMLLGIVFTAVGTVSREREQHTLDSLLTLPIDRREILWAKWLGSILSVRRLAWGLAAIWGLALLTGGLHFLAVPLLVLVFLGHVAFAASLGLWFSVVSPSKVQAMLRAMLTLLGIMVASLLLGEKAACTTPMLSLWNLAFASLDQFLYPTASEAVWMYHDFRNTQEEKMVRGLVGALAYATAAVILWSLACERFRREE